MTEGKRVVVLIEDDPDLHEMYIRLLGRKEGVALHAFYNHTDADAFLKDNKADLIFTDKNINRQQLLGTEWIDKLRAGDSVNSITPVILMSANADLKEALAVGAQAFILKGDRMANKLWDALDEWAGRDISAPSHGMTSMGTPDGDGIVR